MKLNRLVYWFQKEIEKLWQEHSDTRKYYLYTEDTIHDSILHKQILDDDPESISDFSTCWKKELVEFVIKEENLKNLYKKGYLKHLTDQYGQKFPKNHVREAPPTILEIREAPPTTSPTILFKRLMFLFFFSVTHTLIF